MSTTTIRLPEDLKARVARAAARAGTTSHNLILEAIAEKTEQLDRRDEFHDLADHRHADIASSGQTIGWDAMRSYLLQRIAGQPAAPPAPSKLPRRA